MAVWGTVRPFLKIRLTDLVTIVLYMVAPNFAANRNAQTPGSSEEAIETLTTEANQ